jgi:hypothetical protein
MARLCSSFKKRKKHCMICLALSFEFKRTPSKINLLLLIFDL